MTMDIGHEAELIADSLNYDPTMSWDDVRDYADLSTGGDLDCIRLDILTDSVVSVIDRETRRRRIP